MEGGVVDAGEYYENYHGHPVPLLEEVTQGLSSHTSRIFLVGDSSLDNKHWFFNPHRQKSTQLHAKSFTDNAINGYEHVLSPPRMVKDVSYWCNMNAVERGLEGKVVTINCAIEESALGDRPHTTLLAQDEFVASHITDNDVLVVSVGGNDIALKPTVSTILSMAGITYVTPHWMIKKWRTAMGIGHMRYLFKSRVEAYVRNILGNGKVKPRAVVVCMIYYPCEVQSGWADFVLNRIGYKSSPQKLQDMINLLYETATCQVTVDGVRVIPVPLYHALDSKDASDYVEQVEPSVKGGRKMAQSIFSALMESNIFDDLTTETT